MRVAGLASAFFHEFGQDHDALALDPSLDLGRVVGDQRDAVDGGAAFGGEARAFDGEILDQHHGIAGCQRHAVAVAVGGGLGDVLGPCSGFVVEVELLGKIAGPRFGDFGEGAGGEDLNGRVFGPHGGGQGAEVGRVWRVAGGLLGAGRADLGAGVSGAAGDRGLGERGVGCGAEGACHGGEA